MKIRPQLVELIVCKLDAQYKVVNTHNIQSSSKGIQQFIVEIGLVQICIAVHISNISMDFRIEFKWYGSVCF